MEEVSVSTALQAILPEVAGDVVGASPQIAEIRRIVEAIAGRLCTVLITGESGTGKEMIARALHEAGDRREQPFVAVECSSLTGTLFESQLFGHVKGSFTGAQSDTEGFIRAADGGTLFLDEIGELDPPLQAKLLRVLQESEVVPVGATRPLAVDVRVIAATNRDLHQMVRDGQFREDLFYRINVVSVHMPPLRDRREDIPGLAEHFLARQCQRYNEPMRRFDPAALAKLCSYHWPGNVRELINLIERAFVLSSGTVIRAEHIHIVGRQPDGGSKPAAGLPTYEQAERELIAAALRVAGGCKNEAARLLKIERRRLYRMIARHGLNVLCRRSA
jgi:DNA-binding NtrC family response regulator